MSCSKCEPKRQPDHKHREKSLLPEMQGGGWLGLLVKRRRHRDRLALVGNIRNWDLQGLVLCTRSSPGLWLGC